MGYGMNGAPAIGGSSRNLPDGRENWLAPSSGMGCLRWAQLMLIAASPVDSLRRRGSPGPPCGDGHSIPALRGYHPRSKTCISLFRRSRGACRPGGQVSSRAPRAGALQSESSCDRLLTFRRRTQAHATAHARTCVHGVELATHGRAGHGCRTGRRHDGMAMAAAAVAEARAGRGATAGSRRGSSGRGGRWRAGTGGGGRRDLRDLPRAAHAWVLHPVRPHLLQRVLSQLVGAAARCGKAHARARARSPPTNRTRRARRAPPSRGPMTTVQPC